MRFPIRSVSPAAYALALTSQALSRNHEAETGIGPVGFPVDAAAGAGVMIEHRDLPQATHLQVPRVVGQGRPRPQGPDRNHGVEILNLCVCVNVRCNAAPEQLRAGLAKLRFMGSMSPRQR